MNQFAVFRKKAALTQAEVAKVLNIDTSTVAKWETGSSLPRSDKLPVLARMYGCTLDELLACDEKVGVCS